MVAMPPSKVTTARPIQSPRGTRTIRPRSRPAGRRLDAPEVLEAMGLNRDDPVRARVDGQFRRQALDEHGAVLVEE